MTLTPNSAEMRRVLQRLRPPSARTTTLRYGYSVTTNFNPGYTLELQAGEPAVAPGAGTVSSVGQAPVTWSHSAGNALSQGVPQQVIVDHGFGLQSVVHGLSSVDVRAGQSLVRGQRLGSLFSTQIFYGLLSNGKAYDPRSINPHFQIRNGNQLPGQGGTLRFAPDRLVRDLTGGVRTWLSNGVAYFTSCSQQLLVNVDFNGGGSKTGLAATGIAASDYWNVVAAADYNVTFVYAFCDNQSAQQFNISPVIQLYDYNNTLSPVRLFRDTQGNFSGTTGSFDPMLASWIGGYVGMTPRENTFDIRDLPTGTYRIYLYANDSSGANTTTFTVTVNGGSPQVKVNTTTGAPSFIEGANYVVFTIAIEKGDIITVQSEGFISGMQLQRA